MGIVKNISLKVAIEAVLSSNGSFGSTVALFSRIILHTYIYIYIYHNILGTDTNW